MGIWSRNYKIYRITQKIKIDLSNNIFMGMVSFFLFLIVSLNHSIHFVFLKPFLSLLCLFFVEPRVGLILTKINFTRMRLESLIDSYILVFLDLKSSSSIPLKITVRLLELIIISPHSI